MADDLSTESFDALRQRVRQAFGLSDAPRSFAERQHDGFLVALWLDPETAAQLAVDGGESAADLHVTLCYVPDAAALGDLGVARALIAVERAVSYEPALAGRVAGYGRFTASETSDGQDVFWAAVDIPRLADMRQYVVNELCAVGAKPATTHGYTPHVTLAYLGTGAANPVDTVPALDLRFAAVTVMVADKRYDLPLSPDVAMFAVKDDREALHVYQAATFAEPPEWSPFLPVPGVYEHPVYGTLDYTAATYQRIVDQFKAGVYQDKLPVNAEHDPYASGAVGWITDMRIADSGAIEARVEWNDRGTRLIEGDRYLYVSAELMPTWADPVDPDTVYQDVAVGLALTTHPYFKERVLPPLAANEAVLTRQEVVMSDKDAQTKQTPPAREPAVQLSEAEIQAFRQFQEAGGLTAFTELKTRAEAAETRVGNLEADGRRKRFTDVVMGRAEGSDGARWFGEVEPHVTHLVKLADAFGDDSDEVKHYQAVNTAHATQLAESDLFRPIGTGQGGDVGGPLAAVEAQARQFREADSTLTPEQAYARALAANPAAYDAEYGMKGGR